MKTIGEIRGNEGPEFKRAVALWRAGEDDAAKKLLERLVEEHPDSGAVYRTLAGIQYTHDEYRKALPNAEAAVRLAPDSEGASVLLFHCLNRCRYMERAFAEITRFRSRCHSDEYDRLLCEVRDGTLRALSMRPEDPDLKYAMDWLQKELAVRPIRH